MQFLFKNENISLYLSAINISVFSLSRTITHTAYLTSFESSQNSSAIIPQQTKIKTCPGPWRNVLALATPPSPPPTTYRIIHHSSSSVYHKGRKFVKCKFIVLVSVSYVSHRTRLLHRQLHAWELILMFFSYYTNRAAKQNDHCKQSYVSKSVLSFVIISMGSSNNWRQCLVCTFSPFVFFLDCSNYYSSFPDT